MSLLPAETPGSAAARQRLAELWPNALAVAEILGVGARRVVAMRRDRALLAVWIQELDEYRFPVFQFVDSQPVKGLAALLSIIPDASRSGWGWVEWCLAPHALLDGNRPANYLAAGRLEEVLLAAQEEYSEPPSAGW